MSATFNTALPEPDALGRIPAQPPPPGVTPNFDNPVWNGQGAILSTCICIVLSSIFVILRLYTRIWITRAAGFEDAMLAFSWLITLGVGVVTILTVTVAGGGNHLWDIPLDKFIPRFFQYIFAGSLSSIAANIFTKLAVVQLLVRIASHLKALRYAYRGLMVAIVGYNTVMFFMLLFACSPVQASWYVMITPKKCRPPESVFRPFSIVDCVFSFILVAAPIPLIRIMRNRMSKEQKLALALIMGFGLITCIAPVLRIIETYRSVTDISWAVSNLLTWWSLELHVSIICASATTLKPFFRRHFPALKGLGGSYFGSSGKSRYHPNPASGVSKPRSGLGGSRNADLELGAYGGKPRRKGIGFESVVMSGVNGSGSEGFGSSEDVAGEGKSRESLGSDRSERQLVNEIRGAGGGGTGWAGGDTGGSVSASAGRQSGGGSGSAGERGLRREKSTTVMRGVEQHQHQQKKSEDASGVARGQGIRIDRTFEVRHEVER
ncbi:hypothetical protein EX30DRAFT_364784 [Ascodesmis nigricans]|uniref:Rhodopsin domain-containing protein n=1 Tax=Ascodesmis nigricans TaxID=341454 RepID=A0A4S2MTV5_9PEZI|nr:hypothetical protein EX30DRAFT_364784 [Ascodesmis nigricans]